MSTALGGLTYLGSIGRTPGYIEQPGAELTTDYYGLDTLTRDFDVRPDVVEAFKLVYKKGKQDTQFLWLYVTEVKISDVSGVLGKATVIFKGAQIPIGTNPKAPRNEMVRGGLVTNVVSLSDLLHPPTVDDNGQAVEGSSGTRDVTYRAPWTEWRYITTTDPKILGPAHKGEIIAANKVATTLWARGVLGKTFIKNDEIVPPGVTPTISEQAQFVGLLKVVPSKFDFEQVGNVYTVIERNDLIVVDYLMFLYNNLTGW